MMINTKDVNLWKTRLVKTCGVGSFNHTDSDDEEKVCRKSNKQGCGVW
jgi:hypothetical protein